jgi:two-component system, OmpR family, sensor kinase
MKTRTLLSWSIRNYLTVFPLLLFVFFGSFYLILKTVVLQNIDEILSNRRNNIVNLFYSRKVEPRSDGFGFTDFKVQPANYLSNDLFSDTLIFESTDNEYDEYRKLTTSFVSNGKQYRLEILKAHLETEEIIGTIVIFLGLMFLVLLGAFYLTTKYFSVRLWSPFHETLYRLRDFKVEMSTQLILNDSHIVEFNTLNKSILELTSRTQNAFQNQKQFIENAAHEMQTPVTVIQSQLEMWIGDPTLTERQSEKINTLLDAVQRLSKLNKTLLLLSKIDNQQFPESV